MKANALVLSLILLLVPLSGCSGTDTEVTVDMDSEDLQAIIDENRDDFLNNTTVVVFQEYHNNTTVVNQYSNNTTNNLDQSGTSTSTTTYNYNGSSIENGMQVVRLEWNVSDIFPEISNKRDNNFTVEYSYYDYPTNDDRTDLFTLPCSNYYDAPVQNSNSTTNSPPYWNSNGDVQDDYLDWWDYLYNNTIRDLLIDVAYWGDVETSCRVSSENILFENDVYRIQYGSEYWQYRYDYSQAHVFFEMMLENGTAIDVIEIHATHRYTNYQGITRNGWMGWTVNGLYQEYDTSSYHYDLCPIKWWADDSNNCGQYYGGWEDIPLSFQLTDNVYYDSEFTFTMYYELHPVSN